MAGPSSPQAKGFRPLDLMEGYSAPEVFRHLVEVDDLLSDSFGSESEVKVIALSFLIGQYLKKSQIGLREAVAMIQSSKGCGP